MKIGIASPIEVFTLKHHLNNLTEEDKMLGLGATAVNILIDGFIKAGHKVIVFTLDPSINSKYILEGENLKIIFGSFRTTARFKAFDFCYKEIIQIRDFIVSEKANVEVVNAHWSYEFAVGTILAKVPHIITFRDHSQTILKLTKHFYRFSRMLIDLWVRQNGQYFNYNSVYLKDLIKIEGAIIPNPIMDDLIEQPRIYPEGKIKICFIANGWDYRKNPEAALKAFQLLQNEIPKVELHLIGSGFEKNNPKYDWAEKQGLTNNVFFRGKLAFNDLMQELRDFNIMLHTAREESFGNNLIEAMAKGIPTIGGKSSGAVPWVLDYGKSGILVDVENPSDIADKMIKFLKSSETYEKLSINSIENVKNRFKQSAVCEQYLNEFKKVIIETHKK